MKHWQQEVPCIPVFSPAHFHNITLTVTDNYGEQAYALFALSVEEPEEKEKPDKKIDDIPNDNIDDKKHMEEDNASSLWFIALVAAVAVVIIAMFLIIKKKKSQPDAPSMSVQDPSLFPAPSMQTPAAGLIQQSDTTVQAPIVDLPAPAPNQSDVQVDAGSHGTMQQEYTCIECGQVATFEPEMNSYYCHRCKQRV
jgi:hypothetical protein